MTDISHLNSRIDHLIRDEQVTHSYLHDTLLKYSLELLDRKFENYIRNNFSNVILSAMRLGELSIGVGLSWAKIPQGDDIKKSAVANNTSDQKDKDVVCMIRDTAIKEVGKLDISRICELITILKTKDLKSAVTYLNIVEDTIQ